MIFQLVKDFSDALAAMPAVHPRRRILSLLEEALRRDVHFIARHPTTLFQCMWSTCWWFDSPEADRHYAPVADGAQPTRACRRQLEPRLHQFMERWHETKTAATPKFRWVRSIRAPVTQLGTGLLAVLRGHEDLVHSVAVSADGRYIASGSDDGTARIWDAGSGEHLHCLRAIEGNDNVRKVAFISDGHRLAAGSFSAGSFSTRSSSVVRIWDAQTGELLQSISCGATMAISPDGRLVAGPCEQRSLGVGKGPVGVWALETGVQLLYLEMLDIPDGYMGYVPGGGGGIQCVAFSPDSKRIVIVCPDRSVCVRDAQTGEESVRFDGPRDTSVPVWDAVFSPCGRYIACASNVGVRVWDVEAKNEVRCLRSNHARQGAFMSVAFSPDGRHVAAGTSESAVHLWDVSTGDEVACLLGHEAGWINGLAYFPDGQRLVSCAYDGTVQIWDAQAREERGRLVGTGEPVIAVAYRPDGRQVATGSLEHGSLRFWDALTGLEERCIDRDHGSVQALVYSPDGDQIASSQDGLAGVWDVATGVNLGWLWQREHVSRLRYSPDGQTIVTEAYSDVKAQDRVTVRTWNARDGAELRCYEAGEFSATSVAWSPNGRYIASTTKDRVQVWDADTGNLLRSLCGGECPPWRILFAPDSQRVAGVGEDYIARVWDVETGELLCEFPDNVSRAAFSAHGRWLILGTDDGLVRIRDTESGEELRVLRGHEASVGAVACSPDNRLIASGSGDQTLRIWDVESGAELRCAREHNAR